MGGGLTQEQMDALLDDDGKTELDASEGSSDKNTAQSVNGNKNEAVPDEMGLGLLGEIYNISMGAAAKALSTLVKMKVDISTPNVRVVKKSDLIVNTLEPAVGVKINYIEGLSGDNIFILSQSSIMKLVDLIVGGTGDIDESLEFDEMHLSAISEIMNQMMGASSVSVAEFLNTKIDISVPETFKIEGRYPPEETSDNGELLVTANFTFIVGNIINSEMVTTCTLAFGNDLIVKAMAKFGLSVEKTPAPANTAPPPAAAQQPKPASAAAVQTPSAPEFNPLKHFLDADGPDLAVYAAPEVNPTTPAYPPQQMPGFEPNMYTLFMQQQQQMMQLLERLTPAANNSGTPNPNLDSDSDSDSMQTQQPAGMSIQPAGFRSFDGAMQEETVPFDNMDLIMDLSLDVAVEIGRINKTVNEVLELGEGSIIELDKQWAEPVDILVNGNLVAKGSVVVYEEKFAVRITEIVSPQDKIKAAHNKKQR